MTAAWSEGEPIDRDQLHAVLTEYSSDHHADVLLGIAELHVEHVIGELMDEIDNDAATQAGNADMRAGRFLAQRALQERLDVMRARRGYDEDESVRRFAQRNGLDGGA